MNRSRIASDSTRRGATTINTLRKGEMDLKRIRSCRCRPTRRVIQLWYSYASNRNPQMNHRIDRKLDA